MQETSSSAAPPLGAVRSRPTFVFLVAAAVVGCAILMVAGYTQPVVMGIVQGVGEFLPISSSAHLILVPWFLGWQGGAVDTLTFDVALHLGTLAAIVLYFWRDWMHLLRAVPTLWTWAARRIRGDRSAMSTPQHLLVSVMLATIPAAVLGILFESSIEQSLRNPLITVASLSGVGVLLYIIDRRQKQDRSLDQMTWADAVLIGIAQACALVPGVSRSGATMTMGRYLSFDRTAAARYSFLLSAPITAAAVLAKLDDMLHIQRAEVDFFLIGVGVSAMIGALSIHFLLSYIRRVGFGIFAVYRIALAVVIVIVAVGRG